jgi:hypothetical protein
MAVEDGLTAVEQGSRRSNSPHAQEIIYDMVMPRVTPHRAPRCRPGLDPAQYRAQARPRQRSTSALCRQIRQNGSYSLAKNRIVHIDGVIIKAARRRTPPHGPIAQLDRVADFYSAGCRFESCWDRQCTLRRLNFFGNLPLIAHFLQRRLRWVTISAPPVRGRVSSPRLGSHGTPAAMVLMQRYYSGLCHSAHCH